MKLEFNNPDLTFQFLSRIPQDVPWDGDRHTPKPELSRPLAPALAGPSDDQLPAAKKPKTGMRKRPINGWMRTYQMRMIPTPAQKLELKRCFAAARKAYNWTVKRINTNGMASFITLRNEYRNLNDDDIKPEWTLSLIHI